MTLKKIDATIQEANRKKNLNQMPLFYKRSIDILESFKRDIFKATTMKEAKDAIVSLGLYAAKIVDNYDSEYSMFIYEVADCARKDLGIESLLVK